MAWATGGACGCWLVVTWMGGGNEGRACWVGMKERLAERLDFAPSPTERMEKVSFSAGVVEE